MSMAQIVVMPRTRLIDDNSIIAITGIDGHAFNSWVGPISGKMWLRDFIPLRPQLANSRVMTYGYDMRLVSGKSWDDYRKEFLQELVRSRTEPRVKPILQYLDNIIESIH